MKFTITRTSTYGNNKPCEEAMPYEVTYVDMRAFKTPEEFDEKFGLRAGKWLETGTNHRKINGYIARDIGTEKCWAIEINSLEDLMALCHKYGDLVIETNMWDKETPNIEIYDDYRE